MNIQALKEAAEFISGPQAYIGRPLPIIGPDNKTYVAISADDAIAFYDSVSKDEDRLEEASLDRLTHKHFIKLAGHHWEGGVRTLDFKCVTCGEKWVLVRWVFYQLLTTTGKVWT